jgi:hypothetical protein
MVARKGKNGQSPFPTLMATASSIAHADGSRDMGEAGGGDRHGQVRPRRAQDRVAMDGWSGILGASIVHLLRRGSRVGARRASLFGPTYRAVQDWHADAIALIVAGLAAGPPVAWPLRPARVLASG